MPEETPPEVTPDEPAADPSASGASRSVREQYVRHCLQVLDPAPGDAGKSYAELLQRLQTAIAKELEDVAP